VGVIAAVVGLVGVITGGLITFESNRALQDRETHRQDEIELRAARAAASLELDQLSNLKGELLAMETTRSYAVVQSRYLRSRLTTQQVPILLTHLNRRQIDAYQHAQFCAAMLEEDKRRGSLAGTRELLHLLEPIVRCVEGGRSALARLAE
jgi:surfactin synthase thioesterase subunit